VENFGVRRPYFFEDEDERAVTFIYVRYVEILTEIPHTINEWSWNWSCKMVQLPRGRLRKISGALFGQLPWPAPSPDSLPVIASSGRTSERKCTPLYHGSSMTTSSQLLSKSQRCQKTWRGELWETLRARLEECVRKDEQQLSDVLFKTK
jgi:hypothetical protein